VISYEDYIVQSGMIIPLENKTQKTFYYYLEF